MKLIPLSKTGKHKGKYFAQVDNGDYDWLMQWNWYVFPSKKNLYAMRSFWSKKLKRIVRIKMHRLIMGLKSGDGKILDHKDGNGLNNQRSNLRRCTIQQNNCNKRSCGKSKYLGAVLEKNGTWRTNIAHNGKKIYIGTFKTELQAAVAYNKAAKKYHGEFARLNVIPQTYNTTDNG